MYKSITYIYIYVNHQPIKRTPQHYINQSQAEYFQFLFPYVSGQAPFSRIQSMAKYNTTSFYNSFSLNYSKSRTFNPFGANVSNLGL